MGGLVVKPAPRFFGPDFRLIFAGGAVYHRPDPRSLRYGAVMRFDGVFGPGPDGGFSAMRAANSRRNVASNVTCHTATIRESVGTVLGGA